MNIKKILIFFLYLMMIFISTEYSSCKYESLSPSYEGKDLAYYLQFSSKLFDQRLSPRYSFNPRGYNFLQFTGVEAESGRFHQAIHCEPIRYVQAGIYYLFKTPVVLFFFNAAIFFLPVLYLFFYMPVNNKKDRIFSYLLITIYCLYPSTQEAVSYDLRPYIFLLPLFSLSFLSICFMRPKHEAILLFNTMFLAREETLIFGLIIISFVFIGRYGNHSKYYKKIFIPLLASLVFWFCLILSFFLWSGYENHITPKHPLILYLFSIILLLFTVSKFKKHLSGQNINVLQSCVFLLIFVPLSYNLLFQEDSSIKLAVEYLLYSPQYTLHIGCMSLFLIIVWRVAQNGTKKVLIATVSIITLLFLIITFRFMPATYKKYSERKKDTKIIFSFKKSIDKYKTFVLCDYNTYSAFCDFENVYVYNRLPCFLLKGKSRFYPENKKLLRKLIKDKIEFIVINNENLEIVLREITLYVRRKVKILGKNKLYSIYKIV